MIGALSLDSLRRARETWQGAAWICPRWVGKCGWLIWQICISIRLRNVFRLFFFFGSDYLPILEPTPIVGYRFGSLQLSSSAVAECRLIFSPSLCKRKTSAGLKKTLSAKDHYHSLRRHFLFLSFLDSSVKFSLHIWCKGISILES